MNKTEKREPHWFDHKKNQKKLWILLWTLCGLSLIAELFVERHGHFPIDGFFGFYALLGFLACTLAIVIAKVLGKFLKVDEDYYDHD